MVIKTFNDNFKKVLLERSHTSFEQILIDTNNIIENAALITNKQIKDKIIYGIEDIQQEIKLKLWINACSIPHYFYSFIEIEALIYQLANEVLLETRG